MALEDILAGIGAGFKGGLDAYSWQKEMQQKDRALDQKAEYEANLLELRQMLAQLAEGGRNYRHDTPSGDTVVREQGANDRSAATLNANAIRDRMLEDGRNQRWFTPSGNAILGSETTRRGQDIGATTARRGQDVTAATARRGQDLTFDTNANRDATTRRGQDIGLGTSMMNEQGRNQRAKDRPASVNFFTPGNVTVTPPAGGGRLPFGPAAAPATPNAQPASPGPAASAAPTIDPKLEANARSLMQQFDTEKDPARKAALQQQMKAILDQLRPPQ